MPDPDLPVPRVEVVAGDDQWYDVVLVRPGLRVAKDCDYFSWADAEISAKAWADATNWPLVIDGRVVEK